MQNTEDRKVNIAIVGTGISGVWMVRRALQEGKSVLWIGEPQRNVCSRVAPGICNPMVLKRCNASWMAYEMYPSVFGEYETLENELGVQVLTRMSIERGMRTNDHLLQWQEKADLHDTFLEPQISEKIENDPFTEQFRGRVKHTGRVDLPALIDHMWYSEKVPCHKLQEQMTYADLETFGTSWKYKGWIMDKVVFAEGVHVAENPWFAGVPIVARKGHNVRVKRIDSGNVAYKGKLMYWPLDEDSAYYGSTFDFDNEFPTVDSSGIEKLQDSWSKDTKKRMEIRDVNVGLRPTVKDRKPILGEHPFYPGLYICNGMGTRGVSIAPFASQWLIEDMLGNTRLPSEVDVQRYTEYLNRK